MQALVHLRSHGRSRWSTLSTRNTPSRRPSSAAPTTSSEQPSSYIGAVSTTFTPASIARRSVATQASLATVRSATSPGPRRSRETRSARAIGGGERAGASAWRFSLVRV